MVCCLLVVICLLPLSVGQQDVQHTQDSSSLVAEDPEDVHHKHDPHDHKNEYSDAPEDSVVTQTTTSAETATGSLKENLEDDEASSNSHHKTDEQLSSLEDIIEESKDTSKVFSLTNFIKSWLNPVLQEFQEGLNVAKDKNETLENVNTTQLDTDLMVNNTEIDVKNVTDIGKRVKFNCTGRNVTENTTAIVRLVNSSVLLDFLTFDKNSNNDSTDCILIMFYAPWCKFCARTAAQFNALGRAFIQLDILAVDAVHFSNLNARFGTVAVPNIMVFHSSRSAIRFNQTERSFDKLVEFVMNVTGLEPNKSVEVEDIDYIGPVSSIPTIEPDYLLWCAWIFVILCSSNMFIKSQYGQNAIERVKTLWQEHQHIE